MQGTATVRLFTTLFRFAYIRAAAIYLLSRFLFIAVNEAEFTDGYQLLTWSFSHPVRWHPLYPLAVKPFALWLDPVMAGRLVSILSGLGAMLTLARIAERLYGTRAASIVCWLYIASPLVFWCNLRVLTESTFQLTTFAAIYFLLIYTSNHQAPAARRFIFCSGLTLLTRPEGIVLLPLALYLLGRARLRWRELPQWLAACSSWLLYAMWTFTVQRADSYSSIVLENLAAWRWEEGLTFLVQYTDLYPYVMFYPVFLFAFLHIVRIPGPADETAAEFRTAWKLLLLYFHASFALILLLHAAWSTRFLLIPLSFLLVEASAFLIRRPAVTKMAVIAGCIVFSLAAIFLQKEIFADFKSAAIAARNQFPSSRILSDEQAKTNYHLGRDVVVYQRTGELNPGDVVILHSFITDLILEKEELDRRYRYRVLYSAKSSVVPLLGNVAVSKLRETNSPVVVVHRFHRQEFQSVVLVIDAVK